MMKPIRPLTLFLALTLALLPPASLAESNASPAPSASPQATAAVSLTAAVPPTAAPAPQIVDAGLSLGIHAVRYPQLSGLDDPAIEAAINARILSEGQIDTLLARLAAVLSLETPLQVTWQGQLTNGLFSCAMSALGPVYDGRVTQVWSAVNVDTATGEAITFADLFTDEAAAREAIEALLLDEIAPSLSAHLENSDLTPLPEVFSLSPTGLTLHYPIQSLSTLSGRAGTITIRWHELRDFLHLGEGTVLRRLGAEGSVTLTPESGQRIRDFAAQGMLPGIPATLGDQVTALLDTYRELFDPDLMEGGRLITLEDGAFRDVFIITDTLSASLDKSVCQGIRADNLCFEGLCTGQTTQEAWRAVLGQPDSTVTLDATRAESYRLVPGQSDYYVCGTYRLRLHADENGVLQTIILTQ